MRAKDRLFHERQQRVDGFDFGKRTASVFDDMLDRSVPYYAEIQRMVVELAGVFMKDGTRVYDLGCSTGTTLMQLAQTHPKRDVQFVGVDNSEPMLQKARAKLSRSGSGNRCELKAADLNDLVVENASVVIMVLTLQFVRPLYRDALIKRLYQGLVSQGSLILVEKVLCNDSRLNRIFIDQYYEFKKRQGYSELEIAQKREALENVLIPYRIDENLELLTRNGFSGTEVFFRWYNFAAIVAVKNGQS